MLTRLFLNKNVTLTSGTAQEVPAKRTGKKSCMSLKDVAAATHGSERV